MKKKTGIILFLVFVLIFVQFPGLQPGYAANAASGNQNVQVTKVLNPTDIFEGGETEVTLQIQGSPDQTVVKPNDVILIIDKSGSMAGSYAPNKGEDKMKNAKDAAKGFIDLMDLTKHRVGIVDFSTSASTFPLTTDKVAAKNYIDKVQANGSTATGDAIQKAMEMLQNHRPEAQPVIILMTDGDATVPTQDPYGFAMQKAKQAKDAGIVFYTIALLLPTEDPATSGPNKLMMDMATTAHHHHFVLGSVGLSDIYAAIVHEIGIASAYDVKVMDYISPEFEIVPGSYTDNIPQPTISGNSITWSFLELKNELLTFKYKIKHKQGAAVGKLPAGAQDINVQYKDYMGVQSQNTVPQPIINVKRYAPVITSVEKDKGQIQGGEQVVIKGENFKPNSVVTFGNTKLTSVNYVSSNELIVTAPAGVQGTVQIKVTNDDGQFATADYLYYALPEFSGINPKEGPLAGGNDVVITGKYFMNGVEVRFNGIIGVVKNSTATQITVTVPASTVPGGANIDIINPDGTKVTEQNAYQYLEGPVVTKVNPSSGSITGGNEVVITGDHFRPGAVVKFGTKSLTTEFVSATELKVIAPAWSTAQSVDVIVVNPDLQSTTFAKGYTYQNPDPIIDKITPNEGLVAGGDLVTVEGKNFLPDSKIVFKDSEVATTYVDATHLHARSPKWAVAESVDIFVKNSDGKYGKLEKGFTYKLPPAFEFTEVSPNSGPIAGGNLVYLNGSNFDSSLLVYVNNVKVTYTFVSSQQLSLRMPKATDAGKINIRIADTYNRELAKEYEYLAPASLPAPIVLKITPNETLRTAGEVITIDGQNFQSGATVWLNDTKVSATFVSANQLRFRAPTWSKDEIVDVKVVNPDGQVGNTLPLHFLNPPADPAPEITSLSPDSGEIAGGYFVTINGNYFKSGATVSFGTLKVGATYLSANQLRVRAPQWSVAEAVKVTVSNPDGLSGDATFTYTPPAAKPGPEIVDMTPNQSVIAGGGLVNINGKNFSAQSTVKFGGQAVGATFMSDTQLRIRVPAWPQIGMVEVIVENADGQQAKWNFEYIPAPAPSITSLSPNHGQVDASELITINGEGFQSGSKVYFNDKEVTVSFLSDKQLRVRAPIWLTAETVTLKVLNPDGLSGTSPFTFDPKPMKPAPVITTLSPNSAAKASNILVLINGANFVSGSKVSIDNGPPIAATLMSSTQLKIRLPISSKTGPVDVTVINPDGQSVTLPGGFTYL